MQYTIDRRNESMEKALDIARYIINHESAKKRSITNLRLQKLLYFCQGSVIMNTEGKLCFEDDIEAWEYGPVVPAVYREYCGCYFFDIPYKESSFVPEYQNIIDDTLEEASRMSTSTLVRITHCQNPWDETYESGKKKVIPKDLLINYFIEKQKKDQAGNGHI